MNVVDDVLVIEEKGIYSVEKFLMSRRLMYWQVYLHKTSLVAELILTKILKRAKELTQKGVVLPCSEPLRFFMQHKITFETFDTTNLNLFSQLDDFDIISALKSWQNQDDFILSSLSKMIINRDLLKIKVGNEKVSAAEFYLLKERFALKTNLTLDETNYFILKVKLKVKRIAKKLSLFGF